MSGTSAIRVQELCAGYGSAQVLHGVTFDLREGTCLVVLGPNGVGKTTLMKAITGTISQFSGSIQMLGNDVTRESSQKRLRHIGWVPEGRQLFTDMTVIDTLRLSARAAGRSGEFEEQLAFCLDLMPALRAKLTAVSGSLSGGQQQMVALARALVRRPDILLLDEPSIGLAPKLLEDLAVAMDGLRSHGLSIMVAEQNTAWLGDVADEAIVLRHGVIGHRGDASTLKDRDLLRKLYLDA